MPQVQELVERIGARGHVTFGGRLPAGAKGVPGQRHGQDPGRRLAGPERIRGWAADVAMALVSLDRPGQLHA